MLSVTHELLLLLIFTAHTETADRNTVTKEHSRKFACLEGWSQDDKIMLSCQVNALRTSDLWEEYIRADHLFL